MTTVDTLFDEIPADYTYFCSEQWESTGFAYKADEIQQLAEELHKYWAEWDADAWTVSDIMDAVLRIPVGETITLCDIVIEKLAPIKGIFVNEDGCIPYARAIAQGIKPIETRNRNMLSALVGERVAIVSTRRSRSPIVVGFATIDKAEFMTVKQLDEIRDKTLIPVGSKYDALNHGKWCYTMTDPVSTRPIWFDPSAIVRHGRSWCEF